MKTRIHTAEWIENNGIEVNGIVPKTISKTTKKLIDMDMENKMITEFRKKYPGYSYDQAIKAVRYGKIDVCNPLKK